MLESSLETFIENGFISLVATRSTLVLRVTNRSGHPMTNLVLHLVVGTPLVVLVGNPECRIKRLEGQSTQYFNISIQLTARSRASYSGEAEFFIWIKGSGPENEEINLGMRKQTVKVVGSSEQIPKRFLIGKALDSKNSELFQGRDEIFKTILDSLCGGTQRERYFLDGIRRVGKTSILKMLPSFLPDKIIPVYFNFEDTVLGRRGPLESWRILQDFCFKLNDSLPTGSLPAVPDTANFRTDPGCTFRSYLESVKTALPGRVPLFMFDEFPDLLVAVARSGIGSDCETLVLDELATLLDTGELCAIFTGSVRFYSVFDILDHRLLKSLSPLRVSFISEEGVSSVLRAGMGTWVKMPPETITSVFDQTGGYPWFVQMYGAFLVDLMNLEGRTIATPGDVAIVTREQILPTSTNFEFWWSPTHLGSPGDRSALLARAQYSTIAARQTFSALTVDLEDWWSSCHLGDSEERFVERLFRDYPETESVPVLQFLSGLSAEEQGEFKRALNNLRACEVLDSDQADVLRIRGAALRQWLNTRTYDGRPRIERSQSSKSEALSQAGLFIDHENLMAALEEVAKAHGLHVPLGQEKVAWLSSILKHLVDEATQRVGTLTCRVAVAFWDRAVESRLHTAYHHHDFQLKQPEEIKMGNAVDFKLVTEVHRAQQQAAKEGARLEQVIIVSGDGDYAHLARALKNEGVNMQIWAGSRSVNSGYREIIGRENVVLLDDVCGICGI